MWNTRKAKEDINLKNYKMTNIQFAKLFTVPETPEQTNQLLIQKDYDEESDAPNYKINLTTVHPAMTVTIGLGYNDEVKRDEIFNSFDQTMANEWFVRLMNQADELS